MPRLVLFERDSKELSEEHCEEHLRPCQLAPHSQQRPRRRLSWPPEPRLWHWEAEAHKHTRRQREMNLINDDRHTGPI